MPTEVLLLADVKDLGAEGDVVRVADGYARNYLYPRSLGAPVTEATRRRLAKMRQTREQAVKMALKTAQDLAEKLDGVSCTVTVKVGEGDKLYGSVTAAMVADALKAQELDIDRSQLVLESPIRELGVFTVPIRLHPDVEASVRVWVVEE
ncbi:MAG: 50S ribosomal protein L9 [Kiritimatiellae bacterium]|nr:50S ribosomal protein L9 [Kiritimatiellia bacterium]